MKEHLLKFVLAFVSVFAVFILSGYELPDSTWFPNKSAPLQQNEEELKLCLPPYHAPPVGWPFTMRRDVDEPVYCTGAYTQYNSVAFLLNFIIFFGAWSLLFYGVSRMRKKL